MMLYELDDIERKVLLGMPSRTEAVRRYRTYYAATTGEDDRKQRENAMYIDIERVDEPRLPEPPRCEIDPYDPSLANGEYRKPSISGVYLMNKEARKDLIEAANKLAYDYILHSGTYKSISNEQWDALAEKMALRVLGLLDNMIETESYRD